MLQGDLHTVVSRAVRGPHLVELKNPAVSRRVAIIVAQHPTRVKGDA